MKILKSSQVKEVDAFTIENEPIHSINLMERAARQLTKWLSREFGPCMGIHVFVGPGNNGGDGLAVARQLAEMSFVVTVYLVKISDKLSPDAKTNLERLKSQEKGRIRTIEHKEHFPKIGKGEVVIDGLFGSGLNRPLQGLPADLIHHLNGCKATRIAIDIPSGLFGEDNANNNYQSIFRAHHTLTFQFPGISFFMPENQDITGEWHVLPIGLNEGKIAEMDSPYFLITQELVKKQLKIRKRFDHKGHYGHILLISGAYGKMGAAVLAARAALKSGSGLVTAHIPKVGYDIMQTALSEAMISLDDSDTIFSNLPELDHFDHVGAGPGLGTEQSTQEALAKLLKSNTKPVVLDADALNILAQHKDWLDMLPENSILTPHPKEFERLTRGVDNHYQRIQMQMHFAEKYQIYLVLKGGNTTIATPDGKLYFNSAGNPGMATGGSGDVLTGMITSLLGQGYHPEWAAITGVYLHALAGDIAADKTGADSLIASDIIDAIGLAFKSIRKK